MKWYTGEIAEAIVYSKSKGAVFVVYIEGIDEQSQKITSLIENGEIGQKLEKDCFVAIKIQGGSTAHHQFSEIYKEPSIPSIYFIGKNGVPLDIITGNDNLDNVSERIDISLSKAGINFPMASVPASVASDNFIKNEQAASNVKEVVCEDGVCKLVNTDSTKEFKNSEGTKDPEKGTEVTEAVEGEDKSSKIVKNDDEVKTDKENTTVEGTPDESKTLTPEEKVQRARELIELKRQQKEAEEKENERLKEIERRKMGQSVQQMKKLQEDLELKQLKEEREREKREAQQARERVLAQIAQDRAERLSKQQNSPPPVAETSKTASQSPPKVSSNITRLQFKLPDGSSVTQEFNNSDSLEVVVSYIRSHIPLPYSDFTLATMFPRREFTKNDYSQSLMDLQLTPSAVILVLPISSGPISSNSGGGFTALIWSLLTPLFSIFDYLKSFVFGSSSNSRSQKRPSPDEPAESSRMNTKRRADSQNTVPRRQSNIHRLADNNDSDDENNTWNGNSTQQM